MLNEISFLVSGLLLGVSAGLSPGPLQTLVISETLRHNLREGTKVSFAPLMTDLPIVLVTVFVLSKLSNFDWILGIIAILGAFFLGYLSYENIKGVKLELDNKLLRVDTIKKGFITNLLNPHPYMFWLLVGAPTVVKAIHTSVLSAPMFILSFYIGLIGSFIVVAIFVAKCRFLLKGNAYVFAMRFLGLVLLLFSLIFLRNGLKYFGII